MLSAKAIINTAINGLSDLEIIGLKISSRLDAMIGVRTIVQQGWSRLVDGFLPHSCYRQRSDSLQSAIYRMEVDVTGTSIWATSDPVLYLAHAIMDKISIENGYCISSCLLRDMHRPGVVRINVGKFFLYMAYSPERLATTVTLGFRVNKYLNANDIYASMTETVEYVPE